MQQAGPSKKSKRHGHHAFKGGQTQRRFVFTDPAILGVTSSGDVDDIVAILYASSILRDSVTFVVCDDDKNSTRFRLFKDRLGDLLHRLYGVEFIQENDIVTRNLNGAILHVHSQVNALTAQKIIESSFDKAFVQGDVVNAYNFSSEGGKLLFAYLSELEPARVQMYSTNDTSFDIQKSDELHERLHPTLQEVYRDLFLFNIRKKIGLAAGTRFADRLYSDTGNNGAVGNGIKPFVELIKQMRAEGKLHLSPKLSAALKATTTLYPPAEDTMRNLHDLVAILNMYCDYESLLVDNMLPNMSNLGQVRVRKDVDPEVRAAFENNKSTPLFDFAAMYWALDNQPTTKEALGSKVENVLLQVNADVLALQILT